MNTCDTCEHWDRQPDHTRRHFDHQKEVIDGVDVFGICRSGKLSCGGFHPLEDGLTSDYGYHVGGETEIYTGPKFVCLHHEWKIPPCKTTVMSWPLPEPPDQPKP